MKAHVRSKHGLDVDEYRDKWNLPASYPTIAKTYRDSLTERAKNFGLPARMRAAREAKAIKRGKPAFKSVGGKANG